ncbi:thiamine biosynthesis protein ThiC, partial [Erythrobacter sp.]|uniref:thiamine biosynthesis protein ThiC n=1 Tax=Erythrobacter sp. TaxID=1042 RepID=UPI002EC40B0B|nr:thiamine biosynthesis protein ThiC [Erythrobacter sp.]
MDFSPRQSATIVAFLLISAAVSQSLYTALYLNAPEVNRLPIWSVEAMIFVAIAAFASVPMVHSKAFTAAWGALFASAILNVGQVGVGLFMFGPFFDAAEAVPGMQPAAGAVVAYSFFVYNAAKVLIAFAALIFGLAHMKAGGGLAKAIGGLAALVGVIAIIANAASMAAGRDVF